MFVVGFTSKVVKIENCDCLLNSNDSKAKNQHKQHISSYTDK